MASEFKHVRGVVEATAQNAPDRYGFRIGQEWYDGFGSCPVDKGAEVEVAYVHDGRFRNVKEVWLADRERPQQTGEEGADESAERSPEQARITRAVALKCAAMLYGSDWVSTKQVLALAEKLEKWLRADSQ